MSDDTLQWQNFKLGDEKALEAIFVLYHKDLFQYGYKIAVSKALVDDAIQDLFLELWQSRERLSEVLSVRAYLFRALKYKLIRVCKKEAALPRHSCNLDELLEFSYEAVLIKEQQENEMHDKLRAYIQQLAPRQQEALYLRYYCKLTYREISTIMSISSQAVTNLVFKSIKYLREHFVIVVLALASLL